MTIKSLYAAPDGQLWVGTFKGGLHAYDANTNRFTSYFGANTPHLPALSDAIVNTITPAGAYLWIGTDKYGGLHKFDPQSGRYVDYPMREALHQHLLNVNVKAIHADQLGNLWLSTFGRGLVLFNEQTGRITTFEHLPGDHNSLPRNDVTHVLEDQQGQIWVATKGGGISRLDRQRQQFQTFDTRNGLQNNTVLGLLQDKRGQIWASTINGISRWENENQHFKNYSYTNGFPLEELNEGAYFAAANGQLFFGGSNGFVTFDPATLTDNTYVPPVYLTALKLFNKDVAPGDDTRLLNASMLQTDELQLRYFQSIITLEFTALNFLRPEQNRYQYKLEGLEDDWNEVGNQRSATYTNLKEGSYTFLLKGANNDGLWNPEPTQLKITVEAPPWRTWWAILLYSLVILLGIYLLRYLNLRSARLKNEIRIKELEKEKLEEVHQLKLQSFTDVSHEFRTPLTLIIDPLEQVLEKHKAEDWLGRQLHLMHFNARRLLLLVNQVLDINALETGADDYLAKPFIMRELRSRIQNRLKMRDLLRRRYSHGPDLQTEALQLNSYDEELLQRVQAAVETHLDDPDWSVEALAEAVNLSRVHLYRKLKGLLDVSPSTFIRNIRLQHAAQLLAQNKVNVSEVAYRVGFQDPAYFGKSFKKQYGLSPSQYAQQAGK